jgi:hypothetical protein
MHAMPRATSIHCRSRGRNHSCGATIAGRPPAPEPLAENPGSHWPGFSLRAPVQLAAQTHRSLDVFNLLSNIDARLNMAPTDRKLDVVPPADEPEEMPLPSDPKDIFLGGLFFLVRCCSFA